MAQAASGPVIPSGYVTDGLVFFLDSLQLVDSGTWTDIVGGKTFALTDCTVSGGGVVFNGTTSKGVYDGAITTDWANETIEVAITGLGTKSHSVLGQPYQNGTVGISMILAENYQNRQTAMIAINASGRNFYWPPLNAVVISARSGLCVADKGVVTATQYATPGKNETNTTTLGHRIIGTSISSYFRGTIFAIRIYNRQLTEAEMLQNQQADIERYGLVI